MIEKEEELLSEVKKYQKIIVYGVGNVSKTIIRFLVSHNIKISGVAWKKDSSKNILGFQVYKLESYQEFAEEALVIIACNYNVMSEEEKEALSKKAFKSIRFIDYEMFVRLSNEENIKMDFLCVGFVKSGTSSLHKALSKNKKIFLPKVKENYYLHWRNKFDDAPKRLKELYYKEAEEGMILGNIEPSYHKRALAAYECFGKNCKIIFMMRNPADAAYSYFKMMMRRPKSKELVNFYKGSHGFHAKMFDKYIEKYLLNGREKRFHYDIWIQQYLKYFDRENVMFIFFEEAIKEPTRIMNEVQEFIGVPKKKYKEMPHSNDGKEVSRNYISAYINYKLLLKKNNSKSKESQDNANTMIKNIQKIHKYTMCTNNEKMLPESREVLNHFYKESIKNLEKIIGRSLEGVWY